MRETNFADLEALLVLLKFVVFEDLLKQRGIFAGEGLGGGHGGCGSSGELGLAAREVMDGSWRGSGDGGELW